MTEEHGNGLPSLKLFLSADVKGSTVFKYRYQQSDEQPWFNMFQEFFRVFPREFYTILCKEMGKTNFHIPIIWKYRGDEILMYARIEQISELVIYLISFRKAVQECNERLTRHIVPLRLKPTAWLAEFPVTNSIIKTPVGLLGFDRKTGKEAAEEYNDFIGPALDIGFRISDFSTQTKFIISAEIAWALIHLSHSSTSQTGNFRFYYDGRKELKGVDEEYPVVWIDMENEIDKELAWTNQHKILAKDYKDFASMLYKFIDRPTNPIRVPYFIEPNDWPSWYIRKLAKQIKVLNEVHRKPKVDTSGLKAKETMCEDIKKLRQTLREIYPEF